MALLSFKLVIMYFFSTLFTPLYNYICLYFGIVNLIRISTIIKVYDLKPFIKKRYIIVMNNRLQINIWIDNLLSVLN